MKRRKYVIANWKMNGNLVRAKALAARILDDIADVDVAPEQVAVIICPPFPYLADLAGMLAGSIIQLGAQNVSEYSEGAHTGEVCAGMLADFLCTYAIIGHSERRRDQAESDEQVAIKLLAAKQGGLVPIFCLGETLAQREMGEADAVIARQLDAVLEHCGIEGLRGTLIAYEPIWAIGTGHTATPEQANDTHCFIRKRLAGYSAHIAETVPILYGGSVNGENAADLFAMPDIDGGLVGGASLDAQSFLRIVRAAA
ncbi:MAG: triose-phosphate isomerase [Candidatus Eutrophobiaceae bacterium]